MGQKKGLLSRKGSDSPVLQTLGCLCVGGRTKSLQLGGGEYQPGAAGDWALLGES